MNEFIGIIELFGGNFAPRGWAFCNGQLLAIAEYESLYSLIGTTYGGDGQTTFALPNLQSRWPIGTSPNYILGQTGGVENVTLTSANIPAHNHALNVSNTNGTSHAPTTASSIAAPTDINGDSVSGFTSTVPNTVLPANTIKPTGGNQPHNNLSPHLAVNYIICLEGIYPSQN
jgi:microcystin-dependent protein